MIINSENIRNLGVAYNAAFQNGFAGYQSLYQQIATTVPSTTATEQYAWLMEMPGMREWIGDRQIQNLATSDYSIKNKKWELTVSVPRDAIEDDTYGTYAPMMTDMGRAVSAHPDELIFKLLKEGFSTPCFDGQYFFDTDHPVLGENGKVTSVSNCVGTYAPGARPWFVMDTSRALKPLIFQMRKPPQFVPKTQPDSENVFWQGKFVYGTDGRWNVGFGFWQMAYGSCNALNEDGLTDVLGKMGSFKSDHGRPLGISPNILVVPPTLEVAANKLVTATFGPTGASNVLAGRLKVLVVPWLA